MLKIFWGWTVSSKDVRMIANYIYFYHVEKFCVIPEYPDSITDSLPSNFAQTQALSRSAPVFSYSNSGPRSVNINLKLHRDLMNDLNTNVSNLKSEVVDFTGDDYIDTLIKYLQSVALPRYRNYSTGQKSVIPPMVAIRFGDDIFIKGVVNSGIQVQYEKPILWNNKYAQVSITFSVFETEPYSADDVIAEGSFRGITAAFKNGIYASTDDSNSINNSNFATSNNKESKSTSIKTLDNVRKVKQKQHIIHTSSSGSSHGGHGGTWGNSGGGRYTPWIIEER